MTTGNGGGGQEKIVGYFSKNDSPVKFITTEKENDIISNALETTNIGAGPFYSEVAEKYNVQKSLYELYALLYKNETPPFIKANKTIPNYDRYVYAKALVYGMQMYIPIPKAFAKDSYIIIDRAARGHSCDCNSGNNGCVKKSLLGAKYCDAGPCSSCTLIDV
ncbi:MAG: hypothetical protein ACPGQR_01935 [Marinirhabdus sp.]